MPSYTVQNIMPTGESSGQFGDEYAVKFAEDPGTFKLWYKKNVPQEGETVDGHIEGNRFKKEKKAFGNFGGQPAQQSSGQSNYKPARPQSQPQDPFTMYLSYAKDIAVALIAKDGELNDVKYARILDQVSLGGHQLYDGRTFESAKQDIEKKIGAQDAEISRDELNQIFPPGEEHTVDE